MASDTTTMPWTMGEAWSAGVRDWVEVQEGAMRPLFDAVLDDMGVTQGTRVLDVACGAGLFCHLAAQRGATVAGVDVSAASLQAAKDRTPEGDFRLNEIEDLPFGDAMFDLVTSCNALQYAQDFARALGEMKRMLAPGGHIVVATWKPTESRDQDSYYAALAPLMPPPAPGAPNPRRLHQEGVLDAALEQAGLHVEKTVDVDTPWVYPDEETALRGILSYAPGQRAIRASGKERVHAAVREGIQPFRTESGGYVLRNRSLYMVIVPASA